MLRPRLATPSGRTKKAQQTRRMARAHSDAPSGAGGRLLLAQLDGIQEQPGPSARSRLAALTPQKLSGMMAIDRSQFGVVVKILGVGVQMTNAILDPITADNSVVLLVDYQRAMFAGIGSGDRDAINTSAVATLKAARILDVPVVMTSIWEGGNGPFIGQLTEQFPNEKVLERSGQSFDALEDDAVSAAVKATGRKKVIVSGLWTSMCFAFTALHGVRDGYEVYGLIDAAGDATADAHFYGQQRMYQAGVVPITWMPLVSHWMHDWTNPKAGDLKAEVFGAYDAILAM